MAGAKYGLFFGVLWAPLWLLAQRGHVLPLAVFLIIEGIHTAIFDVVVWRRTHLPWMTIGGLFGSTAFLFWAWALLNGIELPGYNWPTFVLTALVVAGPLTLLAASIVNRDEWVAWRDHMEGMSLHDLLLMRHIPHLANNRYGSARNPPFGPALP